MQGVDALQGLVLLLELGQHDIDGGLDDIGDEIDLLRAGIELPAFHPREIQVVLHQVQEILTLLDELLQLLGVLGLEGTHVALGQHAGVRDHARHGVLQLVAHEAEHLGIGLVGRGELLDVPSLFHRLGQSFGDGLPQMHMVGRVAIGLARAQEDEAHRTALHGKHTGHAGPHTFLHENGGRHALRVLFQVGLQIVDDAGRAFLEDRAEARLAGVFRVSLPQEQRFVESPGPVRHHAPAVLFEESQAHAVAGIQTANGLEEEVHEIAERGRGGDLLVDEVQNGLFLLREGFVLSLFRRNISQDRGRFRHGSSTTH